MSLFSPMMKGKSEKNQFFNYFVRILLKFEEKNLGIHKLSWLLITWILKKWNSIKPLLKTFQKSNYLTGTCGAKPIKNYIQKLELSQPWANLFVIQIIASSLLGIRVIETQLSSYSYFFIYIWNLKSTHSVDCQDFKHKTISDKTISGIFVQLSKNPPYFFLPGSIAS